MSEAWGQQETAAFAGQAAANDAVTAGALLRRAREEAGIHVAALAVSLKVPVRKLEALEADRWDVLPDAVFVRALASSVCRTLKTDPQPVLERLPQTTAPRLIQSSDGINTPFRAPGDGAGPGWLDQLSRPVFLAVFALLLGALVLVLLPNAQIEDAMAVMSGAPERTPASRGAPRPAPSADSAVTTVAAMNTAPPVGEPASPTAVVPAAAASASGVSAAAIAAAAAAASAVKPAPSGAPDGTPVAAAAATPASGIIVFRTKGKSWVEVTDAKGIVAVRRVLAAGEAAGVSGALPLQVVIGRVDATEVQVRGKPFDLRRVSHDNVARFQVK